MSLLANILFFLPLCLIICLVSSTLRRDTLAEAMRVGLRLFVKMSVGIIVVCALAYFVMEWWLDY